MFQIQGVSQSAVLKYIQMTPEQRAQQREVLRRDPNLGHYDESLTAFEKIDKVVTSKGLVQPSRQINTHRPRNYGTFQSPSREGEAGDVSEIGHGVRATLAAAKEGVKSVASRLKGKGKSLTRANRRALALAEGTESSASTRLMTVRERIMGK